MSTFSLHHSLFLSLAFHPFFFFPDDSHSSVKSISHLGTGWHWHAGRAMWRLMAKLYYTIAPGWQSTATSQLPYLPGVFMNPATGVCVPTFDFALCRGMFFRGLSAFTQVIDLDQMVLCGPLFNHFHSETMTSNLSYFPSFPSLSSLALFISVSLSPKGWLCPTDQILITQP